MFMAVLLFMVYLPTGMDMGGGGGGLLNECTCIICTWNTVKVFLRLHLCLCHLCHCSEQCMALSQLGFCYTLVRERCYIYSILSVSADP